MVPPMPHPSTHARIHASKGTQAHMPRTWTVNTQKQHRLSPQRKQKHKRGTASSMRRLPTSMQTKVPSGRRHQLRPPGKLLRRMPWCINKWWTTRLFSWARCWQRVVVDKSSPMSSCKIELVPGSDENKTGRCGHGPLTAKGQDPFKDDWLAASAAQ